jgi:hypothetical protein
MLYELRIDGDRNVVCELGVIEHPWPARGQNACEVGKIGHLILLDAQSLWGLEMWGLLEIDGIEAALNRSNEGRTFLRIYGLGDEWTYEPFPAYWHDRPPIYPDDAEVYLGVWPD